MSDTSIFARYRFDIRGFAQDLLGIKLHPGQVRYARKVMARGVDGWRPAYHTIALSSGNRAGKTMVLAIVIMHSCIFKLGMMPPLDSEKDRRRWQRASYMWFHFAIQQEIAELVYTEITNILQGTHVAQKNNGCPLSEMMPSVAVWDKKFNGDYRWIVFDARLGGAEIHFRTTAEKGVGTLGRDMHGISFDEAGLERNLTWIVDNVMHLRRLGTGGQLLLVSTPEEGLTEFADFWFMGDEDSPDRRRGRMSVRMSTRDNVGYGIDQKTFDELIADMDEDHIRQNIDGYFIQGRTAYFNAQSVDNAFDADLPERESARKNSFYIQGVDPALRADSTWSIVVQAIVLPEDQATGEITLFGVRAERLRGKQTTPAIVGLAMDAHNAYDVARLNSQCSTALDATGFGGKMFREALEKEIPTVRSIEFGGSLQKKRKLLGDLRTMLDSGRLIMPRIGVWLAVRRQLLGYKLDDRAIEQDAVMALACIVAEVKRTPTGDSGVLVEFDVFAVDAPPAMLEWTKQPYRRSPRA